MFWASLQYGSELPLTSSVQVLQNSGNLSATRHHKRQTRNITRFPLPTGTRPPRRNAEENGEQPGEVLEVTRGQRHQEDGETA